ncbi:MAG: serine/threonine protein kinase, partial [Nonomuraea sp.]|nr:serine/threonine protein kinase [Nonomuraea sp.]
MDDSTIERFPTERELADLFPGYRVLRLLSETAGSQVCLAEETALRRRVVLKILHRQLAMDEGFRERFAREVMTAAHLEHPNIVPVYAAGESEGRLYLVMRFVEGSDLESVLRERGPLPLDDTLAFVRQLAAALDAAHRAGLVHRDVKPKNVLVDVEENHAYLCDFGIAKKVSAETIGTPGQFVGTAAYASPEQIRGGPVDGRTDVYALGGLIYRCLTGRTTFDGDTPAVLWSHLKVTPPKVSAVRPELGRRVDAVIAKAMAKRPQDRYATCGELADALADAGPGGASASAPGRSKKVWAGVAAGAVALGVAAAVVVTRPWQPDP